MFSRNESQTMEVGVGSLFWWSGPGLLGVCRSRTQALVFPG